MTAYLVRHARAGERADWKGDDQLRPLSKAGRRQAEGLVVLLKDSRVQAVLSSPYLRCIQTVEPLARHFGLPVEPEPVLAEGAGAEGILPLIQRFEGCNSVLCSHGDVLEAFLEQLIEQGVLRRAQARLEKGSVWAIETRDGRVVNAAYLPPPD